MPLLTDTAKKIRTRLALQVLLGQALQALLGQALQALLGQALQALLGQALQALLTLLIGGRRGGRAWAYSGRPQRPVDLQQGR